MPCLIATNSAPKTLVLTVACFFENQTIGAIFTKVIKPVLDRRVCLSPAWSESTNIRKSTSFPRGVLDALVGMASRASP